MSPASRRRLALVVGVILLGLSHLAVSALFTARNDLIPDFYARWAYTVTIELDTSDDPLCFENRGFWPGPARFRRPWPNVSDQWDIPVEDPPGIQPLNR